jgi:glycosyltransferase involved in cell wall biosynthesis
MKIVQLVTQMEAGGAQRVAMLLHDAFCQRGHDCEVWFLYEKRPAFAGKPNVRVLQMRRPSGLRLIHCVVQLAALLRSVRPDVLITHTYYANVVGQSVAWFCRVPNRIAVQHITVETYPLLAKYLDRIFGTIGVYSANVAVSDAVTRSVGDYPSHYRHCLRRIYNGVPPQPRVHGHDPRQRYGLPLDVPLILHVGRLANQKNQHVLLEALAAVPQAHAVFVGDGEDSQKLRCLAADLGVQHRAHFVGEITPPEVWSLLRVGSVFALPSLSEGMPMALLEAMAAHMPIVASDIPAIRDVLGDAGILIPPEDSKALGRAIVRLLSFPEAAAELGRRAGARASMFQLDNTIDSYERLFHISAAA